MLGHEARGAAIEERNAVGSRRKDRDRAQKIGGERCANAAAGAHAANRRRRGTVLIVLVRAVAVSRTMVLNGQLNCRHATVVHFAKRHRQRRIAAQRHGRKHQQNDQGLGDRSHAKNSITTG